MAVRSPTDWWPLFQRAMRAGDLEAVLRLYEPEVAFASTAGQVRSGQAELRQALAPLAEAKADFAVATKKIIQTGDLALLQTEWRITRPRPTSGYALEILRRQEDGNWLLVIGDPFTIGRRDAERELTDTSNTV